MCRLCVCITSLKEEETENHPQTGGVEIAMMILLQCACKQACYPSWKVIIKSSGGRHATSSTSPGLAKPQWIPYLIAQHAQSHNLLLYSKRKYSQNCAFPLSALARRTTHLNEAERSSRRHPLGLYRILHVDRFLFDTSCLRYFVSLPYYSKMKVQNTSDRAVYRYASFCSTGTSISMWYCKFNWKHYQNWIMDSPLFLIRDC